MTKLSIFVMIAMLVMVSTAFRFQSRMRAQTGNPEDWFTPDTCAYGDSNTAWTTCTTPGQTCYTCCSSCFDVVGEQACQMSAQC
nr:En-1 pheromone precursor [Euplotes nobilii]